MAINPKRAKVDPEAIKKVIDRGGSTPNSEEKVDKNIEESDVRFTVTMPYQLASAIDRLRKPSKTSRQAWLMQAALDKIEKMKKDGDISTDIY
jgi:hypothetical protein